MTPPDLSGAIWRKSSRSGGGSGQCIEITRARDTIAVRDSKNPDGPHIYLGMSDWKLFVSGLKIGAVANPSES